MTFVTPAVTQGGMLGAAGGTGTAGTTGSTGAGMLGGESATSGMSSLDAIAASQPGYLPNGSESALDAVAASQPGYNAATGTALQNLKAGSTLGTAAKGLSAYNTMSKAMGGGQQQRPGPASQPVFQGEQPQIAPQGQPGQNQNAVLAAIARRRQRGF